MHTVHKVFLDDCMENIASRIPAAAAAFLPLHAGCGMCGTISLCASEKETIY